MRKNDKLKNIQEANKKLLGESIPDEIQDRLTTLKSQYGLTDNGPDDCEELKRRVREVITELNSYISEMSEYRKDYEDESMHNLSDEDFYSAGELNGELDKAEEIIGKLEQILIP